MALLAAPGWDPWLPGWLMTIGVVAFAVVTLVHLRRVPTAQGGVRRWHLSQVLMALGMADMLWPSSAMPLGYPLGALLFAAGAIAMLTFGALGAVHGERRDWWTVVSAVDLAAMGYMFVMPESTWIPLTLVLAGWFGAEAGVWLGRSPRSRRVMPALMAVSMGYLLLVQQWATPAMPGMPGMPGMPLMSEHGTADVPARGRLEVWRKEKDLDARRIRESPFVAKVNGDRGWSPRDRRSHASVPDRLQRRVGAGSHG